ncbi:MAG: hypothetical protein JWO30_3947 [Fibrobacteres bacterium]|nr:hypothetical protein [Fibrobacterota bacterium]
MKISLLAAFLLLPFHAAAARNSSLGLATVSSGTWAAYGDLDGFVPKPYADGLERYEFNKIAVLGLYGTLAGQPAFLSLPWLWTSKRLYTGTVDRIALGDGEFYLGQKLGGVECRAGLIFPAGYDTRDGDPWIGSGNIQVTLGAAVNPNITRYSRRWEFSMEAKVAYALDDAIAKAGSWGGYPSGKLSFRPSEKWKVGLEGLGYWKSSYWARSASLGQSLLGRDGPKPQWNAGLVPNLFVEDFLSAGLALGFKAGHSLWGYRDAAAYNASAYLLWFP